MKNFKNGKMIIVLLVAIVMMSISTNVLATELVDPTQGNGDAVLDLNIFTDYPEGENKGEGETTQKPTTQQPTTPTTPTTPSNQETLPQTGDASDYAIFLLIGLFAVVSIYAYRKVRDYNRI